MEKELKLNGVIYKITSPNNKIYIGQSINFEQRCRKYKYQAFKGQIKLWNDCQKYMWNPIDCIEIIEICRRDKLDDREKYWIRKYDCYVNGLNADLGGKTRKGFNHSVETKEKLRLINLGNKHNDETKKKISEASKNISDETRNKMSEASKGRTHSNETKNKISEINKGRKLTEEQKLKISISSFGNQKRLNKKHSDETKDKIRKIKKGVPNTHLFVKIICINSGEIYESQIDAAIKLNLNPSSISRVCNKKRKTYNGLEFMFYDEFLKIKNF